MVFLLELLLGLLLVSILAIFGAVVSVGIMLRGLKRLTVWSKPNLLFFLVVIYMSDLVLMLFGLCATIVCVAWAIAWAVHKAGGT